MPDWLAASIVLSLVLTLVANVALRVVPGGAQRLEERVRRRIEDGRTLGDGRVQVHVPWRWMIGLSVLGTILLNLLL